MLIAAYLVPVVACLLLRFAFGFHGEWTSYLGVFFFGEATVGLLHYLFYESRTSSKEYLGSHVTKVRHIDEWIELREVEVTKTDSQGRSYTVKEIKEVRHPEEYWFDTVLGTEVKTDYSFYNMVCRKWSGPLRHHSWTGENIKYGIRHGQSKSFWNEQINSTADHDKYITISEEHFYTNKIRNSNSVFNFERISAKEARELGLYEWPKPDGNYDVPAILSHKSLLSTKNGRG